MASEERSSLFHSSHKYQNVYDVPGTLLSAGYLAVNNTDKSGIWPLGNISSLFQPPIESLLVHILNFNKYTSGVFWSRVPITLSPPIHLSRLCSSILFSRPPSLTLQSSLTNHLCPQSFPGYLYYRLTFHSCVFQVSLPDYLVLFPR